MTERIAIKYVRLFELRLLHHYWLDDGATIFDALPESLKTQRLLTYEFGQLFTVTPTKTSEKLLRQFKCLYKNTSLGCFVSAPAGVALPTDFKLEFMLTVKAPTLLNYTAFTLASQKIYELFNSVDNKIYRYKENVAAFSNLTGASRGSGINKILYLSKEFKALAPADRVESLYKIGSALMQLNSDQPDANPLQIHPNVTSSPVFANQGDAPVIVPPSGLSDVPSRGVVLSGDIADDIFALIQLAALNATDADYSFIDSAGLAKTLCPVYQIRFKNRATTRKYIKKQTGLVNSMDANSTPLTFYGNAGVKQKPANELPKVEMSGSKVSKIVSEVFI